MQNNLGFFKIWNPVVSTNGKSGRKHSNMFLVVFMIQMSILRLSTAFTIIRGPQDSFLSHLRNFVNDSTYTCEVDSQYCQCNYSHGTFVWNNKELKGECLSDEFMAGRQSQECYRFSNGDYMRLLSADKMRCNELPQISCGAKLSIPVQGNSRGQPNCYLDWQTSEFSTNGYGWRPVSGYAPAFHLLHGASTQEMILQPYDVNDFFQKWNGTFLKLNIMCTYDDPMGYGSKCALFKVPGVFRTKNLAKITAAPETRRFPKTSDKTTVLPTQARETTRPPSTPSAIASRPNVVTRRESPEEQSDSTSFEVAYFVVLSVLAAFIAVGIVIFVLYLKKRWKKTHERPVAKGREPTAGNSNIEAVYDEPFVITVPSRMQGVYEQAEEEDVAGHLGQASKSHGQLKDQRNFETRIIDNQIDSSFIPRSPDRGIYDNIDEGRDMTLEYPLSVNATMESPHIYSELEEDLRSTRFTLRPDFYSVYATPVEENDRPQGNARISSLTTDPAVLSDSDPVYDEPSEADDRPPEQGNQNNQLSVTENQESAGRNSEPYYFLLEQGILNLGSSV